MQYQRGSPTGQAYELMHPPGREVLSVKLNDYQGSHPKNLRNDRNIYQNQYITEQITNDQDHENLCKLSQELIWASIVDFTGLKECFNSYIHKKSVLSIKKVKVQRHADLNLRMRNPLFHEFHYKKVIEPQYTIPVKKQEIEYVNSYIKNVHNADSLDIFQQNYLARQKNLDRAKWGNNLMNYDLDVQKGISDNATNFKQQLNSQNSYPTKTDFPIENDNNYNFRKGSPPPPQQQYQNYNPQRASAPNIHKIPPSSSQQQQLQNIPPSNYQQQQQNLPPSRQMYQQLGPQNGYPPSRQVQSQTNLLSQQQLQGQQYGQNNPQGDNYYQQNNGYNDNKQFEQRGSENYYPDQQQQQQQQQNRYKDFDNAQYQQSLEQQERQFKQQLQQQVPTNEPYPNQNNQVKQNFNQNMQENRSPYPTQSPNQQFQQPQQFQEQYQPSNQQQNDDQIYSSPDILSDKRMRKIYNPLIQRVSAVYEPRYGVNANWDKYDREQFRNWENKEQHYFNIVKSKNFILDQHADYSTGNHEYGTKKVIN